MRPGTRGSWYHGCDGCEQVRVEGAQGAQGAGQGSGCVSVPRRLARAAWRARRTSSTFRRSICSSKTRKRACCWTSRIWSMRVARAACVSEAPLVDLAQAAHAVAEPGLVERHAGLPRNAAGELLDESPRAPAASAAARPAAPSAAGGIAGTADRSARAAPAPASGRRRRTGAGRHGARAADRRRPPAPAAARPRRRWQPPMSGRRHRQAWRVVSAWLSSVASAHRARVPPAPRARRDPASPTASSTVSGAGCRASTADSSSRSPPTVINSAHA